MLMSALEPAFSRRAVSVRLGFGRGFRGGGPELPLSVLDASWRGRGGMYMPQRKPV